MSTTQVLRASNPPAVSHLHTESGSSNRLHKKITPNVAVPTTSKTTAQTVHAKKMTRKSSKPLLTWFQRKLGGSVRAKRSENTPVVIGDLGLGRPSQTNPRGPGRAVSSPLPQQSLVTAPKQDLKRESGSIARRTTFSSSNELEESSEYPRAFDDGASLGSSSYVPDSLWSPTSVHEADDDASLRPIPPSAPPSPSPSRSSSSYLSDPRTFRSMAASTKPTTILSLDLGNPGMAHIAQVPHNAPANPVHRIAPHLRHSSSLSGPTYLTSSNSITFSALPSSSQQTSHSPVSRQPGSIGSLNFNSPNSLVPGSSNHVQAPLHTSHHPRNNPRPSSPPLDNASMLTLASSAFAHPGRGGVQAYSITTTVLGDGASHYGESVAFPDGESTSHFHLGDEDRLDERDIDASVRALRPRSSRRGSWESEASRWSARVQNGTGTPSVARDRSLWTANSIRTGAFSAEYRNDDDDVFDNDKSEIAHESTASRCADEDKAQSIIERQTLEVPAHEHAKSALHRPSTETIAQPPTPARSCTSLLIGNVESSLVLQ